MWFNQERARKRDWKRGEDDVGGGEEETNGDFEQAELGSEVE